MEKRHEGPREKAYGFAKKAPRIQTGGTMKRPDGTITAHIPEQLALVLAAWRPIFERFKDGEPSVGSFMAAFGPYMKAHAWNTEPITGAALIKVVLQMPPSSASLDS